MTELVLSAIARGTPFDDVTDTVGPEWIEHNTFPGEVFLELAADALGVAGVSRAEPVAVAELSGRWPFEPVGRSHKAKTDYVVRTVVMIHAGVEPDLIDETGWWRVNDLWFHSLAALWACIELAAARSGTDASAVCDRLR